MDAEGGSVVEEEGLMEMVYQALQHPVSAVQSSLVCLCRNARLKPRSLFRTAK
jgi:hypothetical protein